MVRGEYYIMDRERESEREAKGTKEQTERGVGMEEEKSIFGNASDGLSNFKRKT